MNIKNFQGLPPVEQKRIKELYIFDLDGTLSLPSHRRHLVEAPVCPKCKGFGEVPSKFALEGTDDFTQCGCKGGKDKDFEPNWIAFFDQAIMDPPNWPVVKVLLQMYATGADIMVWSGRDSRVREGALAWLTTYTGLSVDVFDSILRMRPEGDFTPDEQLKRAWLNKLSPQDRQRLVGVFDDRQKVVDMWRKEGVCCFQVAPGNF